MKLGLEALVQLSRAWWLVRHSRFDKWSHDMGERIPGDYIDNELEVPETAGEIRWAIKAVNRAAFGKMTCLMQAVAGQKMLRARAIRGTIVLGAKIDKEDGAGEMLAHAWLRVGLHIILGGEEKPGYHPIASYHDMLGDHAPKKNPRRYEQSAD